MLGEKCAHRGFAGAVDDKRRVAGFSPRRFGARIRDEGRTASPKRRPRFDDAIGREPRKIAPEVGLRRRAVLWRRRDRERERNARAGEPTEATPDDAQRDVDPR
jgi:hypothetical protein